MEILGYIASLLTGILLGSLGGGGSILTLPVLVYFFSISPVTATVYSLFIVGSSSLIGSIRFRRMGMIDYRAVLLLVISSALMVLLCRQYVLPLLPGQIYIPGMYYISTNRLFMIVFAVLMLVSSLSMMRNKAEPVAHHKKDHGRTTAMLLLPAGIFIGSLTGILGAGGGFVIVPILLSCLKFTMKKAIGTSLTIIAINALAGFVLSINKIVIDWHLFSSLTLFATAGIWIGNKIASASTDAGLTKGFVVFILLVAISILGKELLFITPI